MLIIFDRNLRQEEQKGINNQRYESSTNIHKLKGGANIASLYGRLKAKYTHLNSHNQRYEMGLSPEAKALFLAIHQEFVSQGITIRGTNDYIEALTKLQKRIMKDEDIDLIRADFEQLKKENHARHSQSNK